MSTSAILTPAPYNFDSARTAPHRWSTVQEKSIATNYPLNIADHDLESTKQDLSPFVQRLYLQFLWLPVSLMPLTHLILSLQRIVPLPNAEGPHPMHTLLEALLSTTSNVSTKYHTELSQILEHGGGAGEAEETMMWYVVEHENAPEGTGGGNDIWTDEKWRKGYLERMEKREVQVQILLYLFKLSLPGPLPQEQPKKPKPKRVKRGRSRTLLDEADPTPDDHLESFMDKLAMWQLLDDLDGTRKRESALVSQAQSAKGKGKLVDERDWTQVFAEDIVEPHFKHILPHQCALLRSKVFPNSLVVNSDIDDGEDTDVEPMDEPPRSKAPLKGGSSTDEGFYDVITDTTLMVPTGVPLSRALSRAASTARTGSSRALSRAPSRGSKPAIATTSARARSLSRAPSMSRVANPPSPAHSTVSTTSYSHSAISRTRSQSIALSESLAQEQRAKRDRIAYGVPDETDNGKKRKAINREVSMSRSFKRAKSKGPGEGIATTAVKEKVDEKEKELEKERERQKAREKELGVTLVEETPVKPRVAKTMPAGRSRSQSQARMPSLNFGVTSIKAEAGHLSVGGTIVHSSPESPDEDDDEEWMMDSSPDIRMFNPSSGSSEGVASGPGGEIDEDDQEEWDKVKQPEGNEDKVDAALTPCKPRPKRHSTKRQ